MVEKERETINSTESKYAHTCFRVTRVPKLMSIYITDLNYYVCPIIIDHRLLKLPSNTKLNVYEELSCSATKITSLTSERLPIILDASDQFCRPISVVKTCAVSHLRVFSDSDLSDVLSIYRRDLSMQICQEASY